ncbi:uncharacterized protein AAG666_022984 isoform 1-T1 [Megaptera novaeangliae]
MGWLVPAADGSLRSEIGDCFYGLLKGGSGCQGRPQRLHVAMATESTGHDLEKQQPRHAACGISVPRRGIEPAPPAVELWSLNYWTAREVPAFLISISDRT